MPNAPFNDADVAFAQGMIPHHRQAILMAAMAADRAGSEQVRQLAADIQAAQGPEIQTMSEWLRSWGESVPEDTGMHPDEASMGEMPGMSMGEMPGMSMGEMPGMMTALQMKELTSASGAEFDRMFLTMMIAHHEGAIEMARSEQEDGENQEAVGLAAQIQVDQTAEIATMRTLLSS